MLDVKVCDSKSDCYFYLNLVIFCNIEDLKFCQFIEYFIVIFEVFFFSIEKYDCGNKFKYYG